MARKTILQALKDARALIVNRNNWTQGKYHGYNEQGGDTYCALGALDAVNAPPATQSILDGAAAELFPKIAGGVHQNVVILNDERNVRPTTTHRRVLKVYDRAIELAEARAASRRKTATA